MIEHLLVYGTLAPGESNHYMMKDIPGVWKTAYFKGIVLKKDWGKWNGYPGIILDNESDEIKGYVFSSRELKEHWDRLDNFEGNDLHIDFDNSLFGNEENEPRLFGKKITDNLHESKIFDGSFTTCKKNKKNCPPWLISAKEITHKKKLKRIEYRNAWLEIYLSLIHISEPTRPY